MWRRPAAVRGLVVRGLVVRRVSVVAVRVLGRRRAPSTAELERAARLHLCVVSASFSFYLRDMNMDMGTWA